MLSRFVKNFPFQYVSDIHLEFMKKLPDIPVQSPFLFLAGDIGDPTKSHFSRFFQKVASQFQEVFYVAGNHEYYQPEKTMKETETLIRSTLSSLSNVHYLNNEVFDLPEVRILGTTLWTSVPDKTPFINDNFRIRYDDTQMLTLKKTRELHQNSVDFLTKELNYSSKPTIVLTHHMPSQRMVDKKYQGSPYNRHFVSSLDNLFQPPLVAWICGHSHGFREELVNGIPCLLNAVGYPLEHTEYKGIYI